MHKLIKKLSGQIRSEQWLCGILSALKNIHLNTMLDRWNDLEYNDTVIANIEEQGGGWALTFKDGWSFFCPDKGIIPKVGDTVRQYGAGIGSVVRGLVVDITS